MNSLILRTATAVLMPLLLHFSLFVMLRGHHEPGGGFAAGLVASGAFALYSLAFGVHAARLALRIDPRRLIAIGLVAASVSAVAPLAVGRPPMTGSWTTLRTPSAEPWELGTPMLFDFGVYLTVIGSTLTIILFLEEE